MKLILLICPDIECRSAQWIDSRKRGDIIRCWRCRHKFRVPHNRKTTRVRLGVSMRYVVEIAVCKHTLVDSVHDRYSDAVKAAKKLINRYPFIIVYAMPRGKSEQQQVVWHWAKKPKRKQ